MKTTTNRETCAACDSVFDGDTPRTTPGCDQCGTCEACGCLIEGDHFDITTCDYGDPTCRGSYKPDANHELAF